MSSQNFFRGRRLRGTPAIREMVRETEIRPQDLVMPYFVAENDDPDFIRPISSMPGQYQMSLKRLEGKVAEAVETGLRGVILFGIPKVKDAMASGAYDDNGPVPSAIRMIKDRWPQLVVMTDVCLCEYTDHGHCGICKDGNVLNDPTLELLAKTSLCYAKAGADFIAPSDMMDGRVGYIRQALDENGFQNLPIISYAVKYASAFYGPFREAAESTPQFGDRKSYQMDPGNWKEALREATADIEEGADVLIVKPALAYLDIIRLLRDNFDIPLAAYHVSGEYSLIKAAAEKGWIDEKLVMMESLTAVKRAGAGMIITYFTEEVLKLLND